MYNLRIADSSACFVGNVVWSFRVWAHHTYIDPDTGLPAATAERNNALRVNVRARLIRHGVPPDEASALASLGREGYANGQVLADALNDGTIRRLYGSGVSPHERMNGVGDVIRRMTQQDAGLLWARATPTEPMRDITPALRGQYVAVPLASGEQILAFRSEDGQVYFCHGLSSGGVDLPTGRLSPLSEGIESPMGGGMALLLERNYRRITPADSRPGDLVVWRETHPGLPFDIVHSAPLTHVSLQGGDFHTDSSRVQTKNGPFIQEANLTLGEVMRLYGPTIEVWRSQRSR